LLLKSGQITLIREAEQAAAMKAIWKWVVGILASLLILRALFAPFLVQSIYSPRGCGMMGYGWGMPRMYGGFQMPGLGWLLGTLIQLGVLVLIILGVVLLWRAIRK
jgi:hypothetical protein